MEKKSNFVKKKQDRGFIVFEFKTCCKTTEIETVVLV